MKKILLLLAVIFAVNNYAIAITSAKDVDIRVHLGAGTIVINKQELALQEDDLILINKGILYLPLRVVSEAMDYQLRWNQEKQSITVFNEDENYRAIIGKDEYYSDEQRLSLYSTPILRGGKTLVPMMFFTEIMHKTLVIDKGHI